MALILAMNAESDARPESDVRVRSWEELDVAEPLLIVDAGNKRN